MKKLLLMLFVACAFGGVVQAQTTNDSAALTTATQIGHGVNFGNMLDSSHVGVWGRDPKPEYYTLVSQAGFTLIRMPICWPAHVSPAPNFTVDPVFFKRIDRVVAQAKQNNLNIILDYHNDDALMKDPDGNADRFVTIWKQVAEHYRNEPATVLFELLNEPAHKLDAPHWNALFAHTLAVVRASNPTRTVVVGPVEWNKIDALPKLILPENDRNLIVTIHYYDPMPFTHQGATWIHGSENWTLGTKWLGTDAEKLAITQAFDKAAAWGAANQRPMYVGEFGTFNTCDMDSRARWTAFVAQTAESHGFSWTYWEFNAGFGVYDPVAEAWRQPLLQALQSH